MSSATSDGGFPTKEADKQKPDRPEHLEAFTLEQLVLCGYCVLSAKLGAGNQSANDAWRRGWTLFKKYQPGEYLRAGGLGWQNVGYGQDSGDHQAQNTAVGFVASQVKLFKFKKTNLDLTASLLPAITEGGRVHFNTNATYYIKIIQDLSWNFSFYGSWDSRPPPTLPKSDYGTSSGLSWTFGNR